MLLGMEVGLGPDHIVLDGDLAPPPQKEAQQPPLFGPCLLCANGRPSTADLLFKSQKFGNFKMLTWFHKIRLMFCLCLIINVTIEDSFSSVIETRFKPLFVVCQACGFFLSLTSSVLSPAAVRPSCSIW